MDEHMIYGSVSLVLVFAALVYHKLQGRERFFAETVLVYHRLMNDPPNSFLLYPFYLTI